ncbi:MAG: radical SAM protein [Deltaproteobacteria bacterium]|nr:radical SAM protein [Deltaproteobacteria bacterium]
MSGGRLMLRLGSSCNNRCAHCLLREAASLPERTTAEALAEIRRGREAGHDVLVLLRGEVTLRPDLGDVVRAAREQGFGEVRLQTNGRLLDEKLLAALRAAGVTHLTISLFGPEAEIHDAAAGVPGAFAETVRGIAGAVAAGFPVVGSIPVVAATVRHLADTVAFLHRLGVEAVQVVLARPNEVGGRLAAPLDQAVAQTRAAALLARQRGLPLTIDALPRCLLCSVDDALRRFPDERVTVVDLHRGATDLHALRRIYRPPRDACECCAEVAGCPRLWHGYVEEMGCEHQLQAFPRADEPEADVCLLHAPWVLSAEPVPRQWDLLALLPDAAPDLVEAQAAGEFAEVPMGLESIRRYLKARSDYRVRVANLAGLYVGAPDQHARLARHLAGLRARVYAVDLHWLLHCQGALEVLRLCRQLHPAARTVVGGMAATHYAQTILEQHATVDFVVAGDGERPVLKLLDVLLRGGDVSTVPNLWYRRHGRVVRSRGTYFAEEESDYRGLAWVPLRRGCAYDCTHCGVSQTATQALFGARSRYRYAPEKVANELLGQAGPPARLQLVGDPILTLGPGGMRRFLAAIGARGADLDVGIDFQLMHATAEVDRLARAFRSVRITIRPDTGDENVRRGQGKPYSNEDLLRCVAAAASRDNVSVALTFTLGLSGDDATALERTLRLSQHLLKLAAKHPIELRFQELWYLQPGSRAFADPAAHDYHADFTDLQTFRRRLAAPLLAGVLHFAPASLDRRGYFDLVLQKHAATNRLLRDAGRRDAAAYRRVRAYVEALRAFVDRYERHGPGGIDATPEEARELGGALRDFFLERALTPPAAAPAVVTDAGSGPIVVGGSGPVLAPLEGAGRAAVLRALGRAEGDVKAVRAGRGEVRLEEPAGTVTLRLAGSGARVTARTDCFDVSGPPPTVAALVPTLVALERERPERLPTLFRPMWGPPGGPGLDADLTPAVVTTACNQRCLFCSLDARARPDEPAAILARLAAGGGAPVVRFGGGEPTLDDRLHAYLRAARAAGYGAGILETNAVRCADGRYTRKLAASGLTTAVVSLHSHRARLSDALTRTPGSFAKTLVGIDALIATDTAVWLSFVVSQRNAHETGEFVGFARERFPRLAGLFLSVLAPVGEGAAAPLLWPRLGEVAPHLAAGLEAAARAGLPVRVRGRAGAPLCFLGGVERFSECLHGRFSDEADPGLVHPAACTACRWRALCPGYWRPYLERFGESEFVAVTGPAPDLAVPA